MIGSAIRSCTSGGTGVGPGVSRYRLITAFPFVAKKSPESSRYFAEAQAYDPLDPSRPLFYRTTDSRSLVVNPLRQSRDSTGVFSQSPRFSQSARSLEKRIRKRQRPSIP